MLLHDVVDSIAYPTNAPLEPEFHALKQPSSAWLPSEVPNDVLSCALRQSLGSSPPCRASPPSFSASTRATFGKTQPRSPKDSVGSEVPLSLTRGCVPDAPPGIPGHLTMLHSQLMGGCQHLCQLPASLMPETDVDPHASPEKMQFCTPLATSDSVADDNAIGEFASGKHQEPGRLFSSQAVQTHDGCELIAFISDNFRTGLPEQSRGRSNIRKPAPIVVSASGVLEHGEFSLHFPVSNRSLSESAVDDRRHVVDYRDALFLAANVIVSPGTVDPADLLGTATAASTRVYLVGSNTNNLEGKHSDERISDSYPCVKNTCGRQIDDALAGQRCPTKADKPRKKKSSKGAKNFAQSMANSASMLEDCSVEKSVINPICVIDEENEKAQHDDTRCKSTTVPQTTLQPQACSAVENARPQFRIGHVFQIPHMVSRVIVALLQFVSMLFSGLW